jgi:hypothetical protein
VLPAQVILLLKCELFGISCSQLVWLSFSIPSWSVPAKAVADGNFGAGAGAGAVVTVAAARRSRQAGARAHISQQEALKLVEEKESSGKGYQQAPCKGLMAVGRGHVMPTQRQLMLFSLGHIASVFSELLFPVSKRARVGVAALSMPHPVRAQSSLVSGRRAELLLLLLLRTPSLAALPLPAPPLLARPGAAEVAATGGARH